MSLLLYHTIITYYLLLLTTHYCGANTHYHLATVGFYSVLPTCPFCRTLRLNTMHSAHGRLHPRFPTTVAPSLSAVSFREVKVVPFKSSSTSGIDSK